VRKDGIPRSFQLAGHTIKVRQVAATKWQHGADSVGIFLPDEYAIELHGSLKGTDRQQTFCHEFFHAMFIVAGRDDLSDDEQLVDCLGHLLQQALTSFE